MISNAVASTLVSDRLVTRAARALARGTLVAALAALAACSGGGASTTVNQQSTPPTDTANSYTGPAPANADVQAFKINLCRTSAPPTAAAAVTTRVASPRCSRARTT